MATYALWRTIALRGAGVFKAIEGRCTIMYNGVLLGLVAFYHVYVSLAVTKADTFFKVIDNQFKTVPLKQTATREY